jgi:hypothetical protein
MKTFRSVFAAMVDLRYLFLVICVGVVALSFSATGLMQDQLTPDLTAEFWQEVPRSEAFAEDRTVEIEAKEFRSLTLDHEHAQRQTHLAIIDLTMSPPARLTW